MSRIGVVLALCLPLLASLAAQTDEELLRGIRERYKFITENLNAFASIEKDIEGESAEGAQMKVYHDNGETILLQATFYGEGGNRTVHQYYHNADLFFVYTVTKLYDLSQPEPARQVTRTEEHRYYFHHGRLIRWLVDVNKQRQTRDRASAEFQAAEREIPEQALHLIELFNRH